MNYFLISQRRYTNFGGGTSRGPSNHSYRARLFHVTLDCLRNILHFFINTLSLIKFCFSSLKTGLLSQKYVLCKNEFLLIFKNSQLENVLHYFIQFSCICRFSWKIFEWIDSISLTNEFRWKSHFKNTAENPTIKCQRLTATNNQISLSNISNVVSNDICMRKKICLSCDGSCR